MKELIVNAYPKSGLTWLVHLLCDLLEAQHQDTPEMEPLSYGHPVTDEWLVRKVHKPYWGEDIAYLKDKTVVWTQRDPRDVVVSAMFYRGVNDLVHAIGVMVQSHYVDYLEGWFKPSQSLNVAKVIFTQYELLHTQPIWVLRGIIQELTGDWLSDARIEEALERQSFENMRQQLGGDTHFMRKGIVGDWRNHFTQETAQMFNVHFGQFMLDQGYVDSLKWWGNE